MFKLSVFTSSLLSQEVPTSMVTVKNTAPPSYDEVFGHISKDEPPQYQDIVHDDT